MKRAKPIADDANRQCYIQDKSLHPQGLRTTCGKILAHSRKQVALFRDHIGAALCVFKIGVTTNNPQERFQGYLSMNFTLMWVICKHDDLGLVHMLEAAFWWQSGTTALDAGMLPRVVVRVLWTSPTTRAPHTMYISLGEEQTNSRELIEESPKHAAFFPPVTAVCWSGGKRIVWLFLGPHHGHVGDFLVLIPSILAHPIPCSGLRCASALNLSTRAQSLPQTMWCCGLQGQNKYFGLSPWSDLERLGDYCDEPALATG